MTGHRPWLENYPERVPPSLVPYPEESVFSMLENSARKYPNRPATAFFGKHIDYAGLLREVERFSAVLASLGVKKGDRVGLVLPNCPQYVIAFYAAVRIGAVVVGNNPLYTERELSHQLKDAGVEVAIVIEQLYPLVDAVRREAGLREVVVAKLNDYMKFPLNLLAPIKFKKDAKHEGKPWPPVPSGAPVKWWKDLMRSESPVPPVATVDPRNDPAGFIYTGGTTGLSKGAMLSHFNMIANATQASEWCYVEEGTEALMCVLPFFHSYGMTTELNLGILRAAKLVLVPRFELHMVLKEVQKERPTLFPGVPKLYQAIVNAPDSRKFDLSSIRACVSGAGALPASVAAKFKELTGGTVVEGYGLTEAAPVTHANPLDGRARAGSIGMPIPDTECRIVAIDEPDRELAPGQEGELLIMGPQVMLGYWNRPDETAMTIRNGWLHTGDVAVMEDDGFFRIVDRIKDMVKVSGFNVYPTEVEDVLYGNPKIAKVCVVGVPDDESGEVLKAYVVLKEGESATPEEIIEWARKDLTGYRVPKSVEFRDSLPETIIGKVLRRVLLEEEKQRAAAKTS
ncbi:MAG: long-chain fatty acid--CoA ligase [Actinomycetota bacterium]